MRSLTSVFASRIDARPVIFARIVIGSMAVIRAVEGWRIGSRVVDPSTLKAPLIPGLTVSSELLLPLMVTWVICAVLFTVGIRIRVVGAILTACMFITLLADEQLYSNHLYLLAIEVLLLTFAGSAKVQDPEKNATVPAWPVVLLKIQLSIVYAFAAITKITPLFLSGALLYLNLRRTGLFALPPSLRTLPILSILSVVAVLTEIFLSLALWSNKYRRVGVVVGVLFHITLTLMIVPEVAIQLFVFSLAVLALYPLYFFPLKETSGQPSPSLATGLRAEGSV